MLRTRFHAWPLTLRCIGVNITSHAEEGKVAGSGELLTPGDAALQLGISFPTIKQRI